MKPKVLLLAAGLSACLVQPDFAQNRLPVLKDVEVAADTVRKQLTISYSISDPEEQEIDVTLKVSGDRGETFLVSTASATGDLGPVRAGKNKTIRWDYAGTPFTVGKGVVKLVANDNYKIKVEELVKQVDVAQLQARTAAIYGMRDYKSEKSLQHLIKARNTIDKEFRLHKLPVERQKFAYLEHTSENIIARKAGQYEEAKTYVVCSHYDAVEGSPGADANASGIAGVLTAMQILSKYDFKHSIKFAGLDLQTIDFRGSTEFVYKGGIKDYEKVDGVVVFDMLGYTSAEPMSQHVPGDFGKLFPEVHAQMVQNQFKADFALSVGNENSGSFSKQFTSSAARYVPELKIISVITPGNGEATPYFQEGDQAAFWYANYRALNVGDGGKSRSPFVYSKNDTMDKLNFAFMSNIVKATVATIAELAEIQHCASVTAIPKVKVPLTTVGVNR